jgi:hypothetical protein
MSHFGHDSFSTVEGARMSKRLMFLKTTKSRDSKG